MAIFKNIVDFHNVFINFSRALKDRQLQCIVDQNNIMYDFDEGILLFNGREISESEFRAMTHENEIFSLINAIQEAVVETWKENTVFVVGKRHLYRFHEKGYYTVNADYLKYELASDMELVAVVQRI